MVAHVGDSNFQIQITVQVLLLARMICSKPSLPHHIVLAKLGAPPIQLDAAFQAITNIHWIS